MREGDLGGLVHDVVRVEAHAAGEEALLEGPHVAAVESARQGERGEREHGRRGEEDRGPPAGGQDEGQRGQAAAQERADLVHRDVDQGLHAALLGLGHRRVEQLVGGAEERVRERLVRPAGEGGGGEAGERGAEDRAHRGEGRAQSQRARDAEVAEGGAAHRGLEQQTHHAHHAVEGAERPEERGARGEARRGLALEQEVHERLDDGAEEDHEGDVAQVGVAQQEGKGERRGGRGAAGGLRVLLPRVPRAAPPPRSPSSPAGGGRRPRGAGRATRPRPGTRRRLPPRWPRRRSARPPSAPCRGRTAR